jgi:DNA-binding NarL/FixJ family response regulator
MTKCQPRILVVDDEPDVISAYKNILSPVHSATGNSKLEQLTDKLFDSAQPTSSAPINYAAEYCSQGEDAVRLVEDSLKSKEPYCVAFIDVRMPPGRDGIWTARQIRSLDPFINIVIVTAYSDISPADIALQVQPPDKLLYMQKPFHSHEIKQFSTALCAKWQAEQDLRHNNENLEALVDERTSELSLAIEALEKSNIKYRKTATDLLKAESKLTAKSDDLAGTNLALQQMMQKNKEDRKEIEQKIMFTIHEMVEPYIERLTKSPLNDAQQSFVKLIHTNLQEITAPFMQGLSHKYFRLNPMEIRVADLIRQGNSTVKIANELNTTKRNIEFYRDQIREKIGIKNTKANLKSVLLDLESDMS